MKTIKIPLLLKCLPKAGVGQPLNITVKSLFPHVLNDLVTEPWTLNSTMLSLIPPGIDSDLCYYLTMSGEEVSLQYFLTWRYRFASASQGQMEKINFLVRTWAGASLPIVEIFWGMQRHITRTTRSVNAQSLPWFDSPSGHLVSDMGLLTLFAILNYLVVATELEA